MKIKSTIITGLCLLQSLVICAHNQHVADSIITTISHIEDDTLRIREIIHFANDTYLNNPELSRIFTDEALKQSVDVNYQLGIGDCYNLYGIIEGDYGNYDLSKENYYKALEIYHLISNNLGVVNIYNNLGLIYSDLGLFVDALDSYIKALKVLEHYDNDDLLSLIYSNLGKLYLEVRDYDKALEYLKKSEGICRKENSGCSSLYVYSMLGSISMHEKDYTKADAYYHRAMQIAKKNHNKVMVSSIYRNKAEICFLKNHNDTALLYYNESYKLAKELNNSTGIIRTMNALGYFYYYLKDYTKALEYLHECSDLSERIGFKEGMKNSALHLSYVYKALNDYERAYDWRVYYYKIYDNMYSNEMFKSITELFTKLEEERRDYDLQLNKQKNKIKSLISYLVVSALLIFFAALYFIQKNIAKRAVCKQEALNKELTSKAIFLVRKNEVFSKIENTLHENKDNFIQENQSTIQGVINEARLAQNEEVWNEFEIYFNKVHKNFHKKLNEDYPNLSVNDRRLCTLLRMNMTTKDISSITQQTAHAIDIARSRLRKKLGIVNKKTSLYTFLTKY